MVHAVRRTPRRSSLRGPAPRGAGVLAACLAVSSWATGCGQRLVEVPAGTPRVVTTTEMIADAVRAVAGERVHVEALMGSGVDPHLYRPTRDAVARLLGADLVLTNGAHLEGRMGDTLSGLAAEGRGVVAFADLLADEPDPTLALLSTPDGGAHDPHVWMDPLRWARAAELLAPRLVALVPEGQREDAQHDFIDGGAPRFRATAEDLVAFGRACVATIPERQRVLVSAHDAFRYFGERFGLEVVGLQGISTESEAGVRRVEELVDLLVARRVPAVFVESSVPDRAIKALVEGARARGLEVTIGGELYSDAMGPRNTTEGKYVGMLDHNLTTITRALGGRVPGGRFEVWRSVAQSVPGPIEIVGGRR